MLSSLTWDGPELLSLRYEGYKGVNWQPSKGLNIYRQPRFREIFNRQIKDPITNIGSLVKWQTDSRPSSEKSIPAKKKVGSDFEWRVYAVSNAKMLEVIRVLGTFWYLRRILLTKPLFYWYWQKGLNFSDNWQSRHPLVTLRYGKLCTFGSIQQQTPPTP